MSQLIQSIQKLLDQLDTVHLELVTPVQSRKALESATGSVAISIRDTSSMLQKLVQGLLVLQQEQDLALAIKLGED